MKAMKATKMMAFRVLKWLALAWAIFIGIVIFTSDASVEIADKEAQWAITIPLVLLAIFFHLEQHKS